MALADYINTGTYSVVENVKYTKKTKEISFVLLVFSDDTKENKLSERVFSFAMDREVRGIDGMEIVNPPENPTKGETYLVSKVNPTGVWADFGGHVAEWEKLDEGEWDMVDCAPGTLLFNKSSELYIEITEMGGTYKPSSTRDDCRVWDSFFTKEKIFNETSNLHKQIYLFIKTLPGFDNTQDV